MRSDYELLIVGDTQRADLSLNPPEYAVITERSLREGLLVILDFSNHPDDERMEAMRAETLGSQPMSSRQACLKMARQSDIYLGI